MSAVARLREKADQQLAPLRARYEALQTREQRFVAAAGIAIVLALVYAALWLPFAHARSRHLADLEAAREVARTLALAEAEVRSRGPGQTVVVDRNLALDAAVEQASRSGVLPKPLTSLQRETGDRVRVIVEGVPYEAATRWMYELQSRYGVRIDVADLDRQDTPGIVNLRLSLSRAP